MGEATEILESPRIPADALRVARRISGIVGDESDETVLAVCLALSALGNGSVLLDLAHPDRALPPVEDDVSDLEWPDPNWWRDHLARSPVTTDEGTPAPLVLEGDHVYLQRYWRAEQRIADNILALIDVDSDKDTASDDVRVADGDGPDGDRGDAVGLDTEQRAAVGAALTSRVLILTGGPGTGKTHTIARILRELAALPGGNRSIALAAPTGKAAARMKQAIAESEGADSRIRRMDASTLHRLLGSVPGDLATFRRTRKDPLPHDVVIVDETSMMDVAILDALLEALRPDCRLILVGDADQLASVSAGNALADLARSRVVPTVELTTNHRNKGGVAALATAIRDGDIEAVDGLLAADGEGAPDLHWFDDIRRPPELVGEWITRWGSELRAAAGAGDVPGALSALDGVRVLCAHRRGPSGVSTWSRYVVDDFRPGPGTWPLGQPMMVTRNRVVPDLFNGDTGVVIADGGIPRVAFTDRIVVAPERLGSDAEASYALTIHKSQGSQFDRVVVVLPDPGSRILTRELLYTAVTRARDEVAVIGSRESLHAALARRVTRASGLTDRLNGGLHR